MNQTKSSFVFFLTAIAALILIAVIPLCNITIHSQFPIRMHFMGITAALFFLVYILLKNKQNKDIAVTFIDLLMLLFYLTHILSFFFMNHKESGVTPLIIETGFLVVYFFFRYFFNNIRTHTLELAGIFFSISVTVISLWALAQFFFQWDVSEQLKQVFKTHHFPVIASLNNPNFLAEFLILSLPVTTGLYFLKKRPVIIVTIVLQATAAFVTYSRLGWAVLIIVLTAAVITAPAQMRKKTLMITGLIILIVSSIFIFHMKTDSTRAERIISGAQNPAKVIFKERSLIYHTSLTMLHDSPFTGFGPGTFSRLYLPYQARTREHLYPEGKSINLDHAHNDFLQKAVETGPAAAVLLFAILCMASLLFFKKLKEKREHAIFFIIPLLFIPYCFWSFPLYLPASRMLFSFSIALAASYSLKIYLPCTLPLKRILSILMLLIYLASAFLIIISAELYTKALFKTDHFKSRKYLKKSLNVYPFNGLSIFTLGTNYLNNGDPRGILMLKKSLCYFSNTRTYLYLGRGYDETGDIYNAEIWYNKALYMQPQNREIQNEVMIFFKKMKKNMKQ